MDGMICQKCLKSWISMIAFRLIARRAVQGCEIFDSLPETFSGFGWCTYRSLRKPIEPSAAVAKWGVGPLITRGGLSSCCPLTLDYTMSRNQKALYTSFPARTL